MPKYKGRRRFPPNFLHFTFYRNTWGGSHRLHFFFSTFFSLSKIIMNNNVYNNNNNDNHINIIHKNNSNVIKMCSDFFEI